MTGLIMLPVVFMLWPHWGAPVVAFLAGMSIGCDLTRWLERRA